MKIEVMTREHIADIAELEKQCFSSPWSESSLIDQLNISTAYFVVATKDNMLLGYAGMHCVVCEAYIDNIAVNPDFRNAGIGSKLIEALVAEAKRRGAEFISLEVRESNAAARLYEKHGFSVVGKRKDFYSAPKEDALIMTLYFEAEIEEN